MIKVKACFPKSTNQHSIAIDNISRDKQYDIHKHYQTSMSFLYKNNSKNSFRDHLQMNSIQKYQKILNLTGFNEKNHESRNSVKLQSRVSTKKRQSLLRSYQLFFRPDKGSDSIDNYNKQNLSAMNRTLKQPQLNCPKITFKMSQNDRISGSLTLKNTRSSFLKTIRAQNLENKSNKKEKTFKSYEVNRKLKKLKQNIELNKLLSSSNLMNIYQQLYTSYESVPFDQNQIVFKNQQEQGQNIEQKQNEKKQKSQKKFKAYEKITVKGENNLRSELKSLAFETDQILNSQQKKIKDN